MVGTEISVSFKEVAQTAYSMTQHRLPPGEQYGLEALEIYDPPPVTMANSTHIVAVAVGADDGFVEIERYVVAHDCGRIINPLVVAGQVVGAIAQGVGETSMEEIVYDAEGQMLNANLLDYLLPTSLDMPNIQLQHIETPSIDTLGGFKGAGEGGLMGAMPAILNAVNDALAAHNANLRSVPLRPDALLQLIAKADNSRFAAARTVLELSDVPRDFPAFDQKDLVDKTVRMHKVGFEGARSGPSRGGSGQKIPI